MSVPIGRLDGLFSGIFGEQKSAEKRSRAPREPFMNADNRPVTLLDLLLLQSQLRGKNWIEVFFDPLGEACVRCWKAQIQVGSRHHVHQGEASRNEIPWVAFHRIRHGIALG